MPTSGPARCFAPAAIACAAIAWAAIAGSPAAAESWRMYTYVPNANVAAGSGSQRIADRITAETGGRLTVQHFFGGSLPIKATDVAQAVGDDVVQLATDGFYAGAVPYGSFLRLPLLVQSPEDYEIAWRIVHEPFEAQFNRIGVSVIGHYTWPASTYFGTFPLTRAADLSGRKIRQGDPSTTDLLKAMGASPIVLGSADVAPALQQGVIHGVITTAGGGARLWSDLLTHNYRLPTFASASLTLVNKERLDKLPADVRTVVARVVTEEMKLISIANLKDEDDAIRDYKARGMVITPAAAADVAAANSQAEPGWRSWAKAKGPEAERLLGELRRALGR